jgi:lysophospholipase L1-like esterase
MPSVVRARATVAVGAALILTAATATTAAADAPTGKYVSLGDSYVAGPLIPDQSGGLCLRSDHNYPSLVADAIGSSSLSDASCSGATTDDLAQTQTDAGIPVNAPQLDSVTSDTRLVTLGIGGNDIGFVGIILTCAALSLTNPFGDPCTAHYTSGGSDQLAAMIDATEPKVAAVLQAIHQHASQARVLVVGYPDILPEHSDGCWPLQPIAYGDVSYLRTTEKELNAMLATAAAQNGAEYVDTYTQTVGHDICKPEGVKWIEGVIPTAPAAPVHPNAEGEETLANIVEAALD